MHWRLIDTDLADPYYVTAADEVLTQTVAKEKNNGILHFYRRQPSGISLGRAEKVDETANISECRKNDVKIVRRSSGGGTIFTDAGCLIYALILKHSNKKYTASELFEKVCSAIIRMLKQFKITAVYKKPNDVLINGKKISGSAQMRKKNRVLIHGTILLDSDVDLMRKVLKNIDTDRVSTINRECSNMPSMNEVKTQLTKEFEDAFNVTTQRSSFTLQEKQKIERLIKEKYGRDEWNFRR